MTPSFYVNGHSSDGHGTSSRTTVHRAECLWALRYGDSPKWRAFETIEEAVAWGERTPFPLNFCGQCLPSRRREGE